MIIDYIKTVLAMLAALYLIDFSLTYEEEE